ncbi:hypothetical protein GEMRC1_000580 [Eukaryota sp. GEM-RC1]
MSELQELIDIITQFFTGATNEKDHDRLHSTLMTYLNSPDVFLIGQSLLQHDDSIILFWGGSAISHFIQKCPQNISSHEWYSFALAVNRSL